MPTLNVVDEQGKVCGERLEGEGLESEVRGGGYPCGTCGSSTGGGGQRSHACIPKLPESLHVTLHLYMQNKDLDFLISSKAPTNFSLHTRQFSRPGSKAT